MTEERIVVVNPLSQFSLRDDGFVIFYMDGDTGTKIQIEFNSVSSLESHAASFLHASKFLETYQHEGFEEAEKELLATMSPQEEVTDEHINKFFELDDE